MWGYVKRGCFLKMTNWDLAACRRSQCVPGAVVNDAPLGCSSVSFLRCLMPAKTIPSCALWCLDYSPAVHALPAGAARKIPICISLAASGANKKNPRQDLKSLSGKNHVLRMNFSWHLGQVMEILPLPRGTRTTWRHLGQSKYRFCRSFRRLVNCRNFRFS